jgi:hypothetical protein
LCSKIFAIASSEGVFVRYYFSFIFIIVLFSGCSLKKDNIDISLYPSPSELCQDKCDETLFSEEVSNSYTQELKDRFFGVWSDSSKIDKNALWGVGYTKNKKGYGRNLLPYTQSEKDSFIANTDEQNFPSLDRDAILIRDSNFRVMPTGEPFFDDPSQAGEGYPFDYFQNSRVYANTPLKVLHRSLDGEWVYAVSYFVEGWVKVEDIAFVDSDFKDEFTTERLFGVTKEPLLIKDSDGFLISKLHIGTLLPYRDSKVLLARKHSLYSPYIERLELGEALEEIPIEPTVSNFEMMAEGMMDDKYSWGGLDGDRDCSMFVRDFYTPFGIYMPRNSKAQAFSKNGEYLDISMMSADEKSRYIAKNAKPYLTLLYKKGHIMIYAGEYEGKPMIIHSSWGVKTIEKGKSGRYIIGKTLLTPLDIGSDLDIADRDSLIIEGIVGMKTINNEMLYE